MEDCCEASFGSVPALFAQLFGIGQSVYVREDSDVGKGQVHAFQHPALY